MDLQTTLFVGFASLAAAGLAVSAGGLILFVRERRANRAASSPDTPEDGGDGTAVRETEES